MNVPAGAATLEITLQHKREGVWPMVAEYSRSSEGLPMRVEQPLHLDLGKIRGLYDRDTYGRRLGEALFAAGLQRFLNETPMRILLVVEDDELRTLHWERLQLPQAGMWIPLCRSQLFLFSRYLPSLSSRPFKQIGTEELRALVLVANPEPTEDHHPLPFTRFDGPGFARIIRQALEGIPCDFLGSFPDTLGEPSLKSLRSLLTKNRYSILHIVAHGEVNATTRETILFFSDSRDKVIRVNSTKLIDQLSSVATLPRFVFLSSCGSADPEAEVGRGGLARRLVYELGIPAVVAMTDLVTIDTAQALTGAFYPRLRASGMVDQALAEAAIDLVDCYDATVPALFSRLRGRPLFLEGGRLHLTSAEKEHGLREMERLFLLRAPTLMPELRKQAELARHGGDDRGWIDSYCRRVLETDFHALARGQKPPVSDSEPVCPFPGLSAFQEQDKQFFFGREQRVNNLVQKMGRTRFLAVLGNSGSGKSSLVLAGLIPALRACEVSLQTAYMRPGSSPASALESVAAGITPSTLLIVDQFEEAFTHCANAEERTRFFDRLLQLSQQCRTVITMRADFWGECAPHTRLVEAILANQELVPPMTTQELRGAMEQQAAAEGLRFEADLSHKVLSDIEGEPGAMPLLQHASRELWQRRHGAWLRSEEYEAMGGVRQAIARTADTFYAELQQDRDREFVRHIFTRLTRIDIESGSPEGRRDTRQRMTWSDLTPCGKKLEEVQTLVHKLADRRLVSVRSLRREGEKEDLEEVEVTHEALIQYWPQLRKWLDEDQEMLRQREILRREAKSWDDNGRDASFLIRGKKLDAVRTASRLPRFGMNELEDAYLAACHTEVPPARPRVLDLAWLLPTVVIATLIAAAGYFRSPSSVNIDATVKQVQFKTDKSNDQVVVLARKEAPWLSLKGFREIRLTPQRISILNNKNQPIPFDGELILKPSRKPSEAEVVIEPKGSAGSTVEVGPIYAYKAADVTLSTHATKELSLDLIGPEQKGDVLLPEVFNLQLTNCSTNIPSLPTDGSPVELQVERSDTRGLSLSYTTEPSGSRFYPEFPKGDVDLLENGFDITSIDFSSVEVSTPGPQSTLHGGKITFPGHKDSEAVELAAKDWLKLGKLKNFKIVSAKLSSQDGTPGLLHLKLFGTAGTLMSGKDGALVDRRLTYLDVALHDRKFLFLAALLLLWLVPTWIAGRKFLEKIKRS